MVKERMVIQREKKENVKTLSTPLFPVDNVEGE